jgi:hypothetical protein
MMTGDFESNPGPSPFAVSQRWIYRTAPGLETSRLVIGAVVTFNGGRVYCCSVQYAGRALPGGTIERVHIPFLPLTELALAHTVIALEGLSELPVSFATRLQEWADDPRGMTTFTVPFDGYLDNLISQQVASLAGGQAA